MKKIFLVLICLSSLGIAFAQNYPQKINAGKHFTDLKDFRGIYQKIYNDSQESDSAKICERTLQWPKLWQKEDLNYSVLNCQNLNDAGNLSQFLNIAKNNIKDFNTFKKQFIKRFEEEKDLLGLENDLRRKTGLNYIFADGRNKSHNSPEDTTSDSPFDLVSDLNEIDESWFGEKSQKPVFEFAKDNDKKIAEKIPTAEENWLNQIKDNIPTDDKNFDNSDNNLSDGLWHTGKKILREKLNVYSLWLRYVGKTAFDAIATDGTFSDPGFDANISEKPNSSEDIPEAIELSYNPLPELNSYINKYIMEESAFKVDAQSGTTNKSELVEYILKIKSAQTQLIREKLARFKRENDRNTENHSGHRNVLNIQMLNEYLDLFRGKLRTLRKNIFPDFLSKPQHSS